MRKLLCTWEEGRHDSIHEREKFSEFRYENAQWTISFILQRHVAARMNAYE